MSKKRKSSHPPEAFGYAIVDKREGTIVNELPIVDLTSAREEAEDYVSGADVDPQDVIICLLVGVLAGNKGDIVWEELARPALLNMKP